LDFPADVGIPSSSTYYSLMTSSDTQVKGDLSILIAADLLLFFIYF